MAYWVRTDIVRPIDCPYCGAPVGQPCRTAKGQRTRYHADRCIYGIVAGPLGGFGSIIDAAKTPRKTVRK